MLIILGLATSLSLPPFNYFLLNFFTFPLFYLFLLKKLDSEKNPPKLIIEFFDNQPNIRNINCYSNDGGNWKKSNLKIEANTLTINFMEPFVPRRGRVNCSLNDDGKWRWFGTQFVIRDN